MDYSFIKDFIGFFIAVGSAYVIMRERLLKTEMLIAQLQKQIDEKQRQISEFKERFEEHKDKVFEVLDEIRTAMHDILLKLERNNVR